MAETKTKAEEIPRAIARGTNLSVSFKHSTNIGKAVRGKDVYHSVRLLVSAVNQKRAIPTKKYGRDTSHKPGIASGRYPKKASIEVLKIINSAIANAKSNHMDTERLYVHRYECGRAVSKNRSSRRGIGRLTNITIELREKPEEKPKEKPKKELEKPKEIPEKPEKIVQKPTKPHKKPESKPKKPETKKKEKPKPKKSTKKEEKR